VRVREPLDRGPGGAADCLHHARVGATVVLALNVPNEPVGGIVHPRGALEARTSGRHETGRKRGGPRRALVSFEDQDLGVRIARCKRRDEAASAPADDDDRDLQVGRCR